jgi:hypothetical protein
MSIYVQSDSERKLPHHFDAACALYGAIETGQRYRLTSFEEVSEGKFDSMIRKNTFVGSVEFMQKVFSRVGIVPNFALKVRYETSTLEKAREIAEHREIFVKPVQTKLFSGLVLDKWSVSCLKDFDDNTEVYLRESFSSPISSEWRCYVHRGKMVDMHCYSGDFRDFPRKKSMIEYMLETDCTPEDIPVSYTLDIAVLENSENRIIEFNDMWAIGNYGIRNDLYLRMLSDRYEEILSLPS